MSKGIFFILEGKETARGEIAAEKLRGFVGIERKVVGRREKWREMREISGVDCARFCSERGKSGEEFSRPE